MSERFDITDGSHRYAPCKGCGAATSMGLRTRNGRLAVECDCGHRGPEVEVPPLDQWSTWPMPSSERDRLAFEAWNAQDRAPSLAVTG